MRRIRLTVAYDGTDYAGWQRQDNAPSVQAALEEAVFRLTGARVVVGGAGRTDAGVHALGQVASFVTEKAIPLVGIQRGLNTYLPPAIAVVGVAEAPLEFDPRRHASGKLYRYRLWNAEARDPLEARTSWHVRAPLDLAAMRAAAATLVGTHDYAAFRASDCERKNTVRAIRRLDVLAEPRAFGVLLLVEVEADAFLKNMVRILVGTLVEAGKRRMSPTDVAAALAAGKREAAGPTAPPQGLALVRVDYAPRVPRAPLAAPDVPPTSDG